jgi:hypothetical protein
MISGVGAAAIIVAPAPASAHFPDLGKRVTVSGKLGDELKGRTATAAIAEAVPGVVAQLDQELTLVGTAMDWACTAQLRSGLLQSVEQALSTEYHCQ